MMIPPDSVDSGRLAAVGMPFCRSGAREPRADERSSDPEHGVRGRQCATSRWLPDVDILQPRWAAAGRRGGLYYGYQVNNIEVRLVGTKRFVAGMGGHLALARLGFGMAQGALTQSRKLAPLAVSSPVSQAAPARLMRLRRRRRIRGRDEEPARD
jgi:hypothetical protein